MNLTSSKILGIDHRIFKTHINSKKIGISIRIRTQAMYYCRFLVIFVLPKMSCFLNF